MPASIHPPSRRTLLPCLALVLAMGGCRQPILPDPPDPPDFPPDLETELTTLNGLVIRGFGEVVSTGPTVLRIHATVTNPTDEEIRSPTLIGPCELIVIASWQRSPYIRLVQPLDGGGSNQSALGLCSTQTGFRTYAPGEVVELTRDDDLVLSELLGPTFEPGRFVISVVVVDEFIYEVLALDTEVVD